MYVEEFIRECLAPHVAANSWGTIDNAGSHHKPNILAALDEAFNGKWYFCAKYSPFLKPIEKLFYLVKSYIQAHEVEALAYPITWINEAFEEYAVAGPQRHMLHGHWNI